MAYTKPSISAYNTSPPADDGSETEANKVKWSTIKTKITDPVKVLAEAINDATETAFNDLASTATDDGTKGFHLVSYPPLAGEVGVTDYEYHWENALRFGAIGDGSTNNTTALGYAKYLPPASDTYVVDDDFDTSHLYGEGIIEKSWGSYPVSRIESSLDFTISADVGLGATTLNPRGFWTDGRYLYVVTQGSYANTTQAEFHILDIQNPAKPTKLASLNLGASGTTHRALSVYGNYAYAQSTSGSCKIIDISNKASPSISATVSLNAGNREKTTIVGDTLIIPKQQYNEIDFYSLKDPLAPELLSTITVTTTTTALYEPIVDGNLLWVIGDSDGLTGNNNLFCIDITTIETPVELAYYLIPAHDNARIGVIRGKYLFTGGFSSTSRLRVIDISDPTSPSVVYTHSTDQGAYLEIVGNYLLSIYGDSRRVYDIRQPNAPILVSDGLSVIGAYPKAVGSYLISSQDGTGAAGPSGNDGNYNPIIRISHLSKMVLNGLSASSIEADEVYADTIRTRGDCSIGSGLGVGPGGVKTRGPVGGRLGIFDKGVFGGVIENTPRAVEAQALSVGDISSATTVFNIHQITTTLHLNIRLKYLLVYDQSVIASARHSIGEKYGSITISSSGTVSTRLAMSDMVTHLDSGTAATVAVTFVNGTGAGGDPVELQVTSAALNIANSRGIFEVSIEGSGYYSVEVA